ncbi:helix-turn-helix transcriptional regulator [Okibacterium endophyticum]
MSHRVRVDADDARPAEQGPVVPPGYLLTTRSLGHSYLDNDDGCRASAHTHPEHVVFWPERATASVDVGGVQWPLSLGQGLWVPAGTPHSASRDPRTTLAATYVVADAWSRPAREAGTVVVDVALRELLMYLAATGMPREQRLRAQVVCLELITEQTRPSIELPIPRDPRISTIARSIIRDPGDDRSIEQWASVTAQSTRTIARAFRNETALTFTQWRTYARLTEAVRLLGDGMPVGAVARRVGYATPSAFTAAFHRTMHQTPRDFLPARSR